MNVYHQDFEVGEYPSGGAEDCFHQERVGRREYSKGSREEFPIRSGGMMIGGTGIVTRKGEKGNIQGWRGGRKERSIPNGEKEETFLYIFLCTLFGNHSSQLPRLIEKLPQWLSGPSPVLPAAGSPADYQTGFK